MLGKERIFINLYSFFLFIQKVKKDFLRVETKIGIKYFLLSFQLDQIVK